MADSEQYPEDTSLNEDSADDLYVRKSGITTLTVGTTQPSSPATNDVWIDTN